MNDKARKVAREEIIHDLVKGNQGPRGDVDKDDMGALAVIARRRMKHSGILDPQTREQIEIQKIVVNEVGADPGLAERQIKAMAENEKWRRRRGRGR